jgi:hypothetical protein
LTYAHKLKYGTGRKGTNAIKNRNREERARQKGRKNKEKSDHTPSVHFSIKWVIFNNSLYGHHENNY